jgi:hypothetical protein
MEAGIIHRDELRDIKRDELSSAADERKLSRETASSAAVTKRRDTLATTFRASDEFREAQTSLSGARGVERLLSKKNPGDPNPSNVRMVISLKQMLRSTGETRFSDADVRQAIPDATLANSVIRFLSLKGTNEGTDADVAALREIAGLMREQSISNLGRHADAMATGQLAQGTGLNAAQIKEQLFTMDVLTSDRDRVVQGELIGTGSGADAVDQAPQLDFSGFGADTEMVKAAVSNIPAKDQARFLRRLQDKQKAVAPKPKAGPFELEGDFNRHDLLPQGGR